ncbi:Uu.00g033020.m01.CDS01 [Anthostomella pinea]|uniref:Uu.00g033020.m01.CDS01 n=1 Tax=Anthostomella pinea TaxID=933095 RepID=A0AAI8V8T1_9PEZI|nr:Uu.00g033020.m01.CDS01 [Anthostomella pinea]
MESLPTESIELVAMQCVLRQAELPQLAMSWCDDLAALARRSRRLHAITTPVLYRAIRDLCGSNVVLWAVRAGQTATLELAYKFGLDLVNPKQLYLPLPYNSFRSPSPILLAIEIGQENVTVWLLDHGIGVDALAEHHISFWSVLHGPRSLLAHALLHGQEAIALLLIARGADLKLRLPRNVLGHLSRSHALHEAAASGCYSVVAHLVNVLQLDVNLSDSAGRTPLHLAAEAMPSNTAIIAQLLTMGANIDAPAFSGQTPLLSALSEDQYTNALHLIRAGACVAPASQPALALTLHVCLRSYFRRGDCDRETRDKVLIELIKRGASPNASSYGDNTPLGMAYRHENVHLVEILLEAGADLNLVDDAGLSIINLDLVYQKRLPVSISGNDDKFGMARVLVKYGQRLDDKGHSVLSLLQTTISRCEHRNQEILLLRSLMELATDQNLDNGHLIEAIEGTMTFHTSHACRVPIDYLKKTSRRDHRFPHLPIWLTPHSFAGFPGARRPSEAKGQASALADFAFLLDSVAPPDTFLTWYNTALGSLRPHLARLVLDRVDFANGARRREQPLWLTATLQFGGADDFLQLITRPDLAKCVYRSRDALLALAVRYRKRRIAAPLMACGASPLLVNREQQCGFDHPRSAFHEALRAGDLAILGDILDTLSPTVLLALRAYAYIPRVLANAQAAKDLIEEREFHLILQADQRNPSSKGKRVWLD